MVDSAFSGLVVKEQSGFYWVEADDNEIYMCELRGRLKEEAQSSDIASIGDYVTFSLRKDEGTGVATGVIESVAERKSVLSRSVRTQGKRGAGQAEREHVIIANADQAIFVFAATQPYPDLRMLDNFLVVGEKSEIENLVIVVNKVDLEDPSIVSAIFMPYEKMGYRILHTSTVGGTGIQELNELLSEKISVFTGPSGVGKTSLLNCIQPGLARSVKSVGRVSSEGVHTTRDSALIKLENKGYLADTPGMRSISVWDVEPDELDAYFVDIAPYVDNCKFSNCTHTIEPKCAVRQAVDKGDVSEVRYKNYLLLREELRDSYIIYNR